MTTVVSFTFLAPRISRINHVFLAIAKYLPSVAFLGEPSFREIFAICRAKPIVGGVTRR